MINSNGVIQSILFNKHIYTKKQALDFLKHHGYNHNKIDITPNFYRFRQIDPEYLQNLGYMRVINKKIAQGIEFIIYYL
jgi:hypothetical protein